MQLQYNVGKIIKLLFLFFIFIFHAPKKNYTIPINILNLNVKQKKKSRNILAFVTSLGIISFVKCFFNTVVKFHKI